MTRVALYARYSSDNQRDASIEDQLRQCRERAVRQGWTIVETYSARAMASQGKLGHLFTPPASPPCAGRPNRSPQTARGSSVLPNILSF